MMSVFPKIAFNTLVQIMGRGVVIGFTIITTALLTRRLGVVGYGDYVFITAFLMLFSSLADWGTGIISVREASKDRRLEKKIYGNALILRLITAALSFLIINLLILVLPQFSRLVLPAVIASSLLFFWSLRTSCQIIFQTKLRFDQHVLVEIFASGLFALFLVVLLGFSSSLSLIFLALSSASLLAAILALILGRKLTSFDFQPDWQLMRKIMIEALPTGGLLLLFSIYNRIDIFILQSLKGAEPVGLYGLAYKVHDNLVLGAAFLANAFFPIIAQYGKMSELKKEFEPMREIYQKLFDVLLMAGLAMVALVFIFSPLIIQIIGGGEFAASVLVLRILVLGTLMAYFNHLTGYSLIALGKQKISLMIAIIALFWNIGLNLLLIPRFSYLAAAGITIATEGLVFILTSFYLARKFRLKPAISFPRTFMELIRTRGKIF